MRLPALLLCACLGSLAWLPVAAAAAPASASPAPFLASQDCFAMWPSYDGWVKMIRAKNPWWNPKALLLPWVFPRRDFERAAAELECRAIAYESDGLEIQGWMVKPRGDADRRLPVLIYNRGGNGSYGALNFALLMQNLFPYAHEGFLVLATQYRGLQEEPGRPGSDEFGGADVRDVTRLIELAAQIPGADPDNLFMLGASRGGMMSFMAARRSQGIKAMAVIAGVSDLQADLAHRPEMERLYAARIPGYATNKRRALAERSVLRWPRELPSRMPLLLLHGDRDDRVHVSNAIKLHLRLNQIGHPNKLVVYAGDDHMLSRHRKQAMAEVVAWFRAAMAPAARTAAQALPGR